jgi:hypothetical protein
MNLFIKTHEEAMRRLTWLARIFWSIVGALLLAVCQTLTYEPPAPEIVMPDEKYLPGDLGEKSVLWLEPSGEDGHLQLKWEKHAVLDFGQAQVPVSVE